MSSEGPREQALAALDQQALKYFDALWASIEKNHGIDLDCEHWGEAIRAAIMRKSATEQHAETIRCMSVVFDDIATMVGLPDKQRGDPDALMDAIEAYRDKATEQMKPLVEALQKDESLHFLSSVWGCGSKTASEIVKSLDAKGLSITRNVGVVSTKLVEAAREADTAMSRIIAGVSTGAITSDHDETMAYTMNHLISWRNSLRQALATIEQEGKTHD